MSTKTWSKEEIPVRDFETWLSKNSRKLFRYWIRRKLPSGMQVNPSNLTAILDDYDREPYEELTRSLGYIKDAVKLDGGDWLLGMHDPYSDNEESVEYYHLSEMHLGYDPDDTEETEERLKLMRNWSDSDWGNDGTD